MPAVFDVTSTEIEHEELALIVPAVSTSDVALAAIVVGVIPVHPVPLTVATVTGPPTALSNPGKLSVRPGFASDTATVFGLLITSFIVEVAPGATAAGVNDFVTVTVLESVALAAIVLVMFCVLVREPTGIVLT